MKKYILKRAIHSIIILWLVATTVFFAVRLIPGDPIETMLGLAGTPEAVAAMREEQGLDQPLYDQYVIWMTNLLQGNLGVSITSGARVTDLIKQSFPITFAIAGVGFIIGVIIAIPAGIVSATRKDQVSDYVATLGAFFGISMPSFFIGILLIVVFAVKLRWLPSFGYTPLSEGFVPWFKNIILPAIAIGTPYTAAVMRMMRTSLLEEFNEDYMRTAHAKGVSKRTRLFKHALQNAMIPVITIGGIQIAVLLTGSVTVEVVFGIKGIGALLVDAILARDYPIVQGVIMLVAVIMITANFIVDILYTFLDPQIKYGGESA